MWVRQQDMPLRRSLEILTGFETACMTGCLVGIRVFRTQELCETEVAGFALLARRHGCLYDTQLPGRLKGRNGTDVRSYPARGRAR